MGGFRALLPAPRFLQRPAQFGNPAACLPFSTKLPTLIGKRTQMRRRFRAKRIKAARQLGAILGRIGNEARRRLLRPGSGGYQQQ